MNPKRKRRGGKGGRGGLCQFETWKSRESKSRARKSRGTASYLAEESDSDLSLGSRNGKHVEHKGLLKTTRRRQEKETRQKSPEGSSVTGMKSNVPGRRPFFYEPTCQAVNRKKKRRRNKNDRGIKRRSAYGSSL